jgi:hypothetical protein
MRSHGITCSANPWPVWCMLKLSQASLWKLVDEVPPPRGW